MGRLMLVTSAVVALIAQIAHAQFESTDETIVAASSTTSIQDISVLADRGESELRGIGLVVGLNGTGDAGSELALARPLAELHRNSGNPLASIDELSKARSVALVWVTCRIPREGARRNDRFDVTVSAMHSATSLSGGTLIVAPLLPPVPDPTARPFAMASGRVVLENEEHPTAGIIDDGAFITQDILMPEIGGTFTLHVDPAFRGWPTTRLLANQINGITSSLAESEDLSAAPTAIARAVDETAVEVRIPSNELKNKANFIAEVLSLRFSRTLLDLPAEVVVNRRTGVIFVDSNVQIAPGVIGAKNLVVRTITPAPAPGVEPPEVRDSNWVEVGTGTRPSETARLQDLIEVFRRLDVPIEDQIHILELLDEAGRLTGDVVIR